MVKISILQFGIHWKQTNYHSYSELVRPSFANSQRLAFPVHTRSSLPNGSSETEPPVSSCRTSYYSGRNTSNKFVVETMRPNIVTEVISDLLIRALLSIFVVY